MHVETCDYMVILKPEQREEFKKKIREKIGLEAQNLVEVKDAPYSHHLLFEVVKDE